MDNSTNNIQQYIEAYQTYLQGIAGNKVTTRVATRSDMNAEGITNSIRQHADEDWYQYYCLGTSYDKWNMYYINERGFIYPEFDDDIKEKAGVRPIIEITIP